MASSCPAMPLSRFALFLPLAALFACATRPTTRPAPRAGAAATTIAGPNTTGPWRLVASYASQGVTLATRAIVVISGDPATRTDTLSASLDASYTWARDGRRRVVGTLNDYRVAPGSSTATVPAGLTLARAFAAEASPTDGAVVFRLPSEGSACTDPALSALQGLHDAWPPVPGLLAIGQEWSDTVRTLSCRDRLAVRGVSVRRFRVVHADVENGRVVVTISRRSTGRMAAEGEQFGESVTLGGESTGMMQYVLDVASGRFVRAVGRASLDLAFKSRRRNQRVKQESELTLTWKP